MRQKMIVIAVALLAGSAALTGCFGKDDEPGATNPTPTTPTPTTPTPSTPTPTTPTNGNGTEPEPETPDDVNLTVEVTGSAGLTTIQPATGSGTFTVAEEGWQTFTVTVTPTEFSADAVDVVVTDSTGAEVGKTTINSAVPPTSPPPAASFEVSGAAPGEFTITATAHTIAGGFKLSCQVVVTY